MKHSQQIFAVVAVALVLTAGFFLRRNAPSISPQGNKIKTITVGSARIQAEVVSSREKMELGLGGRENLCQSCGMLFVFPTAGRPAFWMKGMRFPLDLIWLDNSETVVHVEKNVPPDFAGILTSPENADSVLELNAGTVDKLGIKVGDKIAL